MLNFPYSNETLDAIIKGLDVKDDDDIMGIGGSWDWAFAAIQYANSVTCIDYNAEQAGYAMKRAESLKAGDIGGFFPDCSDHEGNSWNRHKNTAKEYFSRNTLMGKIFKSRSRLEIIRSRLDRIEFKVMRIEDFVKDMQGRKFSKAYLSNVFTYGLLYGGLLKHQHNQRDFIQMLAAKLRNPGIIYLSDGGDFNLKHLYNAEEDRKLTEIARSIEKGVLNWRPAVFRRRA